MLNYAFLIILPDASTPKFLDFTRSFLDDHDITIEEEASVPQEELVRGRWVEKQHALVQLYAMSDSDELSGMINKVEAIKSRFFSIFGELWDAVVSEHRLLSAKDAQIVLGDLSARQLGSQWWSSFHPLNTMQEVYQTQAQLIPGFFVSRFGEGPYYVVNGFYPAEAERWNLGPRLDGQHSVTWMALSYKASLYSVEEFELNLFGALNPEAAQPGSLRQILYTQHGDFNIYYKPSLERHGFELMSGALDSLAAHCRWSRRPLTQMPYGRLLLQEGLPALFLERILSNPLVVTSGIVQPVFDKTAGMPAEKGARRLMELYVSLIEAEHAYEVEKETVGESRAIQLVKTYDFLRGAEPLSLTEGCECEKEARRNTAVVLIKPHAFHKLVFTAVEECLAQQIGGLSIDHVIDLDGHLVKTRNIVDRQYAQLAYYAYSCDPFALEISNKAKEAFEEAYGVRWKEAQTSGRMWTAASAMQLLGNISPKALNDKWQQQPIKVNIASGAYVCQFPSEGGSVYVLNGFYPFLREQFVEPGARTRCYTISWPETCLSWKHFYNEVIGCTDPSLASPSSVRGVLYQQWQALHLSAQPDAAMNGVHASAGPLEAMVERHLWCGMPYALDVLSQQAERQGFSPAVLYAWAGNPIVNVDGMEDYAFNVLKLRETSEVISLLREGEEDARNRCQKEALNRAIVLLHPHSATQKTITIVQEVLTRAMITITAQHHLFAHRATEAMLDTPTMREVAHFCALSRDDLLNAFTCRAIQAFEDRFEVQWGEQVDNVVGGDEAMELLNASPFELLKLFSEADPVKLDRHIHMSYIKKSKLFVVNGFYPYLRETYTAPGSGMVVFEVAWREEDWSWKDFSTVVIGNRDVSKSSPGTLQRILSENWKEFGLQRRSIYRAQCNISASNGPLEAVVDRLRWIVPPHLRSQRLMEDLFVQQLLLEHIPLPQITHLLGGVQQLSNPCALEKERNLLEYLSIHQGTITSVRRIQKRSIAIQDALRQEYGFVWIQASACTERVQKEIEALFASHHIRIIEQGAITMDEVSQRGLLDVPTDPLYRNAVQRCATQIPLSPEERAAFHHFFHISWETVVQLSLVINSVQHIQRVGQKVAVEQWESAQRKVSLSSSLYVGYVETEGLYVVNGFYSFAQSRLYCGPRVRWYSVAWAAEEMDYTNFLEKVVGDMNPAEAAPGSFRRALHDNWKHWGLAMPPDALENGLTACPSPFSAMAERCRWLHQSVEEDVLGRCLIQSGVYPKFIAGAIQNPIAHLKGDTIPHICELFDLMPLDSLSVCETLLALQSGYELTLLPPDTILTQQRPQVILEMDEDDLWGKPEGATEAEVEDYWKHKALTLVLRCGVNTAYEYNMPLEPPVPLAARQWWLSGKPARKLIPQSSPLRQSFAILAISPIFTDAVGERIDTVIELIKDLLYAHHISILVEREVPGTEAEARGVWECQHQRLMRYAAKQSGCETLTEEMREKFEKATGISIENDQVRNALELSSEFNLSARKVERVWEACEHHRRLGTDLYLAKVPREDIFIINGFALAYKEKYTQQDLPKRFLLVAWDSELISYPKFIEEVIGDTHLVNAQPTSVHGVLREHWAKLGLSQAPHPYLGVVSASESAMQAMQQRQVWLGTGLWSDPLGRVALSTSTVSPLVLRYAMRNPPVPPSGALLMDILKGEDATKTFQYLKDMERTYRTQSTRNTALAIVKPHALCKRFANRIEHVFKKHHITIEEEGDISGQAVHDRGLVRYLYPAAAGYAVRNPTSIVLNKEEQKRVFDALQISWEEFVISETLLNAYMALESLGNISPRQLYIMWKASRHRVLIRPDLEITELDDYHVFVVNAFFPALKESFESSNALLHWYVVSWPEKDMSWAVFNEKVVGCRQPSRAEGESIRGCLYRQWQEYGLYSLPDRIQNGIHVSEGPLQGLGERLTLLERPMNEDPLGEVLDRMNIHESVLETWLDNADVTVEGLTAGVFEHVMNYDTSRLIRTLEFLSDDIKAREARNLADTPPMAPEESSLLSTAFSEKEVDSDMEDVETMNLSWRSDLPWTESPVVYRNTSTLFLMPLVSQNAKVKALLLRVLKEHKIRIIHEEERVSTIGLVDRLCFPEAFFAMRSHLEEVLKGEEVTHASRRLFRDVFEETWEDALGEPDRCRIISANEAMHHLRLSAEQLHVKCSVPGQRSVLLGIHLRIVQIKGLDGEQDPLYVVNPSYPFYRQRLEGANGNNIMGIFLVSFDGREYSWKDFREEVIGHPNPAVAAEGSFRGELYRNWKALGLSRAPDVVNNGVRDSDGPLQAFGERIILFGTSDLIPDPLVRSLCMANADPLLLADWAENPLVAYTSSYSHGETRDEDRIPKVCRIFDLLHNMDTRDLSELVRTAESHIRVLSQPRDLRSAARSEALPPPVGRPRRPGGNRDAAPHSDRHTTKTVERTASPDGPHRHMEPADASRMLDDPLPVSRDTHAATCESGDESSSKGETHSCGANSSRVETKTIPEPSPSRLRHKLTASMVCDAILNAKTPNDINDLWDYYLYLSAPEKKGRYTGLAGFGKLHVQVPTIDFQLFRKDFDSLEMFGAPLTSKFSELSKLFASIEEKFNGRMNYNQFVRALALYQTI